MAGETLSPNMSMPVPGVGITDGPQYATDLNLCLGILDSHDHTPGNGVQITPNGLDINSDLSMQSNNLTLARSLRMTAQTSPIAGASDLGCLYVSGVDLYYNDENGNQIRMTASGGVAGTPGSIANLVSPAAANYVSDSSTFVFQSDSGGPTAANLDGASLILRNLTANSYGLTLSPPTLTSNYTITLPTLPASTKFLSISNTGNIGATWAVDSSTIEIASNVVQVKDAGITRPKLSALGQQLSSSSSTFSTASSSFTSVTNLTVTITTTGRPVQLALLCSSGLTNASVSVSVSAGTNALGYLKFARDAAEISSMQFGSINVTAGAYTAYAPATAFSHIDPVAAGTYTYTVEVRRDANSSNIFVTNCSLMAYEIG